MILITLEMTLWPYGAKTRETPLLSSRIWTARTQNGVAVHRYRICDVDGGTVAEGEVDKTRSGHRNPLHLLERILASIDLNSLPRDHITTEWDLPPDLSDRDTPAVDDPSLQPVAVLLGGVEILRHPLKTAIDVHELLLKGLPVAALIHLIEHLTVIDRSAVLEQAVGMTLSTFCQLVDASSKPLALEQSGRTWTFAETLARATALLGSQEAAEQWLVRPQTGLNQHGPIALLATPVGAAIVTEFLLRLEHGVYS